jgi:NAD(P)-dependent dehydrogenase (short-subunit alcohol dehydrogenase family)
MAVVLITGCSSGIGLEAALAFARQGDTVYASMRNTGKAGPLQERASKEGLTIDIVPLDVLDDRSVTDAVTKIEKTHGGIDVVVNNAGVGYSGSVETLDIDKARAVIDTNFWGAVRVIRAAVPQMREKGAGVIINVTSVAGRVRGTPYQAFYSASKHGLGALSEGLQFEVAPYGIRVACIEPGFFTTEIFTNGEIGNVDLTNPYGADHAWLDEFYLKSGQAAGGDPAVVADAIVHAANDPATPLHNLVGDDAAMFVDLGAQAGTFEGWVPVATQIVESAAGPRPVTPKV